MNIESRLTTTEEFSLFSLCVALGWVPLLCPCRNPLCVFQLWPPCCSSELPGAVLPQGLCTACRFSCSALPLCSYMAHAPAVLRSPLTCHLLGEASTTISVALALLLSDTLSSFPALFSFISYHFLTLPAISRVSCGLCLLNPWWQGFCVFTADPVPSTWAFNRYLLNE